MITGVQPDSPALVLRGRPVGAGRGGRSFQFTFQSHDEKWGKTPSYPSRPQTTHPVPSLALKLTLPPSLSPQMMRGGNVQDSNEGSQDPPSAVSRLPLHNQAATSPNRLPPPSPCLAGRKCWPQGRVLSRPCGAEDGHYPESPRALTSSLC